MKLFITIFLFLTVPASAQYYGGGGLRAHGHSAAADGGLVTNFSLLGVFSPKQIKETISSVSIATSNYNIAWASSTIYNISLSSSTTLTFSGALTGESQTFIITQSSNSKIISWPSIKWPYATTPTLSTTTAAVDIISVLYIGTTYYGFPGVFGF